MLKGQKSVRGGIEDFLCPFTDMYITQGSKGSFSHKGIMANDVRGAKSDVRYPYYAPCTVRCVKTYPSSGQVMWQSTNKVRFANGRVDYATFMTAHDDTMDAKVGMIVPQGNQLGNMGEKGVSDGVHCHIQVSQSNDTTWKRISSFVWEGKTHYIYGFNNEYDLDACYFVDDTNILNGMGGTWLKTSDVPVEEPKPVVDEDKEKIKELEKQVTELQEQNKTLENRIAEITAERDKLKEEQPKEIYTCTKDCICQINMFEGEQLFIR